MTKLQEFSNALIDMGVAIKDAVEEIEYLQNKLFHANIALIATVLKCPNTDEAIIDGTIEKLKAAIKGKRFDILYSFPIVIVIYQGDSNCKTLNTWDELVFFLNELKL